MPIDVDPGLEAACRAAGESGPVETAALLGYRELSRRHEQARTADDFLFRRLRVGLTDRRAAEALRPSLAF
jgi:glycerol-3-phosphate dehydrogenase